MERGSPTKHTATVAMLLISRRVFDAEPVAAAPAAAPVAVRIAPPPGSMLTCAARRDWAENKAHSYKCN